MPTPDLEHELRALDDALAGHPVDPDHAELGALVDDVRAGAPRMSPDFAVRLDEQVATGFGRRTRHRLRRWPAPRPGQALAIACSLLLALVVATGALTGGGGDDDAAIETFSGPAAGDESGGGGATATPAPAPDGNLKGGDDTGESLGGTAQTLSPPITRERRTRGGARRVERSTALTLAPPADEFTDVTDQVIQVSDRFRGIVQTSNVSERNGRGRATFDLRIPTSQLDQALAELSRLAHVRSRTSATQDITAPYVSAQERLENARAERRGLLRRLARADTPFEADAIKRRLRDVAFRIAYVRAEFERLRNRVNRAKVSVTVESTGRRKEAGAWTPGDALDDAGRVLEVAAGVAVVTLAVAAPLALLALLAWIPARIARRRRREGALDVA
jgi:hypothetical protein